MPFLSFLFDVKNIHSPSGENSGPESETSPKVNCRNPEPSILTIGITGGVASGKTTVCGLLAEKGVTVHSADELARKAVEPGTAAYDGIVARFGPGILSADASLDQIGRASCRERV